MARFFNKVANSDLFVVMDNVTAPLGRTWLTRNRLFNTEGQFWLSLPVYKQRVPINELKITSDKTFILRHLGQIRQAYKN